MSKTEPAPSGRFACPVCPELRFKTVGDKKQHMRTEHPRVSPKRSE